MIVQTNPETDKVMNNKKSKRNLSKNFGKEVKIKPLMNKKKPTRKRRGR